MTGPIATGEVSIAFCDWRANSFTFQAHLAPQCIPVKYECNSTVVIKVADLVRFVVGIKNDVAGIRNEFLAQYGTPGGLAFRIYGDSNHRVRITLYFLFKRSIEPCLGPMHGVRRQLRGEFRC